MPVEFQCRECGRQLRVPDETVGRKARCPECGTIQEVVAGSSPFAETVQEIPPKAVEFPAFRPSFVPAADGENPYQSPHLTGGASAVSVFLPREAILARVQGPAIALIVTAIFSMLLMVTGFVFQIVFAFAEEGSPSEALGNMGVMLVAAVFYGAMLLGAVRMRKLKSYGLSIVAAALAMVPCSGCCMLTFPIGIWALVVLLDQRVRSAFE
jgi:hypothetical protein